jgi:hypothetical protein
MQRFILAFILNVLLINLSTASNGEGFAPTEDRGTARYDLSRVLTGEAERPSKAEPDGKGLFLEHLTPLATYIEGYDFLSDEDAHKIFLDLTEALLHVKAATFKRFLQFKGASLEGMPEDMYSKDLFMVVSRHAAEDAKLQDLNFRRALYLQFLKLQKVNRFDLIPCIKQCLLHLYVEQRLLKNFHQTRTIGSKMNWKTLDDFKQCEKVTSNILRTSLDGLTTETFRSLDQFKQEWILRERPTDKLSDPTIKIRYNLSSLFENFEATAIHELNWRLLCAEYIYKRSFLMHSIIVNQKTQASTAVLVPQRDTILYPDLVLSPILTEGKMDGWVAPVAMLDDREVIPKDTAKDEGTKRNLVDSAKLILKQATGEKVLTEAQLRRRKKLEALQKAKAKDGAASSSGPAAVSKSATVQKAPAIKSAAVAPKTAPKATTVATQPVGKSANLTNTNPKQLSPAPKQEPTPTKPLGTIDGSTGESGQLEKIIAAHGRQVANLPRKSIKVLPFVQELDAYMFEVSPNLESNTVEEILAPILEVLFDIYVTTRQALAKEVLHFVKVDKEFQPNPNYMVKFYQNVTQDEAQEDDDICEFQDDRANLPQMLCRYLAQDKKARQRFLSLRARLVEDIYCMQLLMHLLPDLTSFPIDVDSRGLTIGNAAQSYADAYTYFSHCYRGLLLEELQARGKGNDCMILEANQLQEPIYEILVPQLNWHSADQAATEQAAIFGKFLLLTSHMMHVATSCGFAPHFDPRVEKRFYKFDPQAGLEPFALPDVAFDVLKKELTADECKTILRLEHKCQLQTEVSQKFGARLKELHAEKSRLTVSNEEYAAAQDRLDKELASAQQALQKQLKELESNRAEIDRQAKTFTRLGETISRFDARIKELEASLAAAADERARVTQGNLALAQEKLALEAQVSEVMLAKEQALVSVEPLKVRNAELEAGLKKARLQLAEAEKAVLREKETAAARIALVEKDNVLLTSNNTDLNQKNQSLSRKLDSAGVAVKKLTDQNHSLQDRVRDVETKLTEAQQTQSKEMEAMRAKLAAAEQLIVTQQKLSSEKDAALRTLLMYRDSDLAKLTDLGNRLEGLEVRATTAEAIVNHIRSAPLVAIWGETFPFPDANGAVQYRTGQRVFTDYAGVIAETSFDVTTDKPHVQEEPEEKK